MAAIWPDSVRRGQWFKIQNPSAEDLSTPVQGKDDIP
jgi:hypothetical protein